MDARITKAEAALFHPLTVTPRLSEVEALRLAAIRARDEAIGRLVRRAAQRVLAAIRWVAHWPSRQQTFEALDSLSDRELADIGLTRGEIGRVFDADFVAANDRGPKARKAA